MNNVRNSICGSRRAMGFTRAAMSHPAINIRILHISSGTAALGVELLGLDYSPILSVFPFKYEGAWGVI